MTELVRLRDVSVHYPEQPTPVVSGISLTLERGELLVILGEQGSGKSSLMRAISGVNSAARGYIELLGKEVEISPAGDRSDGAASEDQQTDLAFVGDETTLHSRRQLGFVFQTPRVLPWRRTRHNVELGLGRSGMTSSDRKRKSYTLLSMVGLNGLEEEFPHQLTPGQRRLLGIARALASDPDVLLMDEPFYSIDPETRKEFLQNVLDIQRQTGVSILFSSHDAEEALCIADRVLILGGAPAHILDERRPAGQRPRSCTDASNSTIADQLRETIRKNRP